MNDLLQSQIKESCKLALPNGLRELMEDISREVLRAQPNDLYDFITQYLESMLEARDNLTIAVRMCEEICNSTCKPELCVDLKDIGLSDEDVDKIEEIIEEYFKKGRVNEQNLLIVLSRKLQLESGMLQAVQEVVRSAYRKHFVNNTVKYDIFSENEGDSAATRAAKNTVKFHKHTSGKQDDEENTNKHKCSLSSVSSMSLAGSFISLPKYLPYSATDCTLSSLSEHPETERCNFDYTEESRKTECNGETSFEIADSIVALEEEL